MKSISPLDLALTPSVLDDSRKLSLASSSNLQRPLRSKPLQKNLLENCLASRLKQHRHARSSNKENSSGVLETKPPKKPSKSAPSGSNRVSLSQTQQTTELPGNRSKSVHCVEGRTESATSSVKTGKKLGREEMPSAHRGIDSVLSDKLPKLPASRKSSAYNASRRSSSAEPIAGRGSLHSGTARMTSASSFFHSSDSTGLVLESRGADYTIKVVKRDGVFRPIDKYAPSRCLPREIGPGGRTIACDYEVFTLPLSSEDTSISKPCSRDTHTEGERRPLKVSWGKAMDNATNDEMETLDNGIESMPPTATPNNLVRVLSSSSSKRPIYSSGKSRVQSIGLRWRVPTAPPDEDDSPIGETPKKPMWSWLVTPDVKLKGSGRLKAAGQLSRDSKNSSKTCLTYSNSALDVRIQHSRDLHPVSTAMAREGTSVSKTKWHVPSSSASTLEAERMAMDRLELVKREGKFRPDNNMDMEDALKNIRTGDMGENDDTDSDEAEMIIKRRQVDDAISYGSKSNRDTATSPAKSRSTHY